jgi:aminoglycoside 6'-N-acetyltransferase
MAAYHFRPFTRDDLPLMRLWRSQPTIGEPDMLDQGHGSAFVRQHFDRLFAAGAPAIGTDPHPANARAIRAYEKAGFAIASGPLETPWGSALLMERWP